MDIQSYKKFTWRANSFIPFLFYEQILVSDVKPKPYPVLNEVEYSFHFVDQKRYDC